MAEPAMSLPILSITDPKDAFLVMLLERIEALEDKVSSLTQITKEQNTSFVVPEGINSFQGVQALKLAPTCSTTCIEDAKKELEQCCVLVEEKLGGHDILKSLVADIILDDHIPCGYVYCCRIYINLKRPVWIHEITRLLASIKYPVEVGTKISKGTISFYNTSTRFSHTQEKGLVYSLFDKDGNRKDTPIWESYVSGYNILVDPFPDEWHSDGEQSDWWPEEGEQ